MAQEITDVIRQDLNLEVAGVLIFKKEADTMAALSFSKSARCAQILEGVGFQLQDITIKNVSQHAFFKRTVYEEQECTTNDIEEVWGGLISSEKIEILKNKSHVKTMLLYPLIKGKEVLGALLLGLNRDYGTLSPFEKESIKSCINAIALLLDKAYLYKELQASYEVEKRAHAVEKKANEELEKIDKFKDQFLTQAQHDLRTPLTSILGYTDLIQQGMFGKQNKKTAEVMKKLRGLTDGMIKKANNFLDLAQFQLGKSPVTIKPGVDLFLILQEIKNDLDFKVETKKIYLNLEQPGVSVLISADREKLKAALFNVVDNSVKYTQQGGVTITVNSKSQITNHKQIKNGTSSAPATKCQIQIKDTGIGLDPQKAKTMFNEMFERSEQAKKMAVGAGVGLYLSVQIIRAHGGKIRVESEGDGKGSTFFIELPIN